MTKSINVLICSGGKRVDLINEFKSVLKNFGKVMITDANELNAGRFFADKFFKAPKIGEEEYLPFMKDVVRKNNIKLIFSVIDTELLTLAKYKHEFSSLGAVTMISSVSSVDITSDKRKTSDFFNKLGILTPKVYKENDEMKFPVFIKPYDGSGSKFAYPISDIHELEIFKKIVPHPFITEFIDGQEYTIDCLSDFSGKIINIIPRKRLEVNNGISVKSIVDMDRNIIIEASKILNELKAIGPSTIQLIRTTIGMNYFMEINLRFGGGVMLGISSGGNFAEKIIRIMEGKEYMFSNDSIKNGYTMVAYLSHKFVNEK